MILESLPLNCSCWRTFEEIQLSHNLLKFTQRSLHWSADMGNCCSRETPDVGKPLLYEKLGENGERKGIDETTKISEMETSELNGDAATTEQFNTE